MCKLSITFVNLNHEKFSFLSLEIDHSKLLFYIFSCTHGRVFARQWRFCKMSQGLQDRIWCYVCKQLHDTDKCYQSIYLINWQKSTLLSSYFLGIYNEQPSFLCSLTVEETLHKLRFCSFATLIASMVLFVATTSCMPAMQSPPVNHSICIL